jgi:type IV pilus assembly protein PilB
MELSSFEQQLIQRDFATLNQIKTARRMRRKDFDQDYLLILEEVTQSSVPSDLLSLYEAHKRSESQILYGMDPINLEQISFSRDGILALIEDYLSIEVCRNASAVPLFLDESTVPTLHIGMVDPTNLPELDRLVRLSKKQGVEVNISLILSKDYISLIQFALDFYAKEKAPFMDRNLDLIDDLDSMSLAEDSWDTHDLYYSAQNAEEEPIITLVAKVLAKAIQNDAIEIYIEPLADALNIRFRDSYAPYLAFPSLPFKIAPAIASRFKVLANLNIGKTTAPQYGQYHCSFRGNKINLVIHIAPTLHGEAVFVKIFKAPLMHAAIPKAFQNSPHFEQLSRLLRRQSGLLIFTEPDTSNLIPFILSLIEMKERLSIRTVENSIGFHFSDVLQTEAPSQHFAQYVRAIHAQHPDVLIIQGLSDKDSALAALDAARNCLVIVIFSMSGVRDTLSFLQELQIHPLTLARSLVGIFSRQRVPLLCSYCQIPYAPTKSELDQLKSLFPDYSSDEQIWYQANRTIDTNQHSSEKCPHCEGSGYKGLAPLYELLEVNDEVTDLLANNALPNAIYNFAIQEGMAGFKAQLLNLLNQRLVVLESIDQVGF